MLANKKDNLKSFKMQSLITRNYQAVVNRGLITKHTTDEEFFGKLCEELKEVEDELIEGNEKEMYQELIDLMNVCTNWLHHRGQDVEKLLTDCAIKNENRIK